MLAGVNDMMGHEVLTDSVGSPAKWSKVVALNAIGVGPVKILDLGIVDWIRAGTKGQMGIILAGDIKYVGVPELYRIAIRSAPQ